MTDAVLRLTGVHLGRGARPVLTGVSFEVARGEIVALMGPSGSGKTTILRAVAALEPFSRGTIAVGEARLEGGVRPSGTTLRQLRRSVGMVFQFHCLFEHLSAIRNVTLAPVHAHGVDQSTAEARARALLGAFGIGHRAGAFPRELSGGEAQRVAIARALAVDPPALLMDEPTASLDPERRSELADLLRALRDQGRALLVATHDEEFARACGASVLRLHDGQVV